ncbi:GPP34 family phosphoprotein [Actinoallomurus purpureus]|uniref:GOLPH3/VPS74 family protein n=1 Tax=Actinoallomurus purpureus TaxID=478114 RepID=UPI00209268A0|nr:GPP34 family phosphoprotein [Actinoallomurus purpureus]MCO6005876.1 GPP34 family phosphoprotein [Actinoallomurus purpureus]
MLAEELLLLAYDLRGKCRIGPVELDCGVGGAMLSELTLAGRLRLDDTALAVTDTEPVGDPILDALLADVAGSPRSRTPQEWVTRLRATDHQQRLLARLADRGQVAVDRHRTLGVFVETRYPVRDIVGLWEAQQRVVAAVTTGAPADARTLALGALVAASGLGKAVFSTSGNWRTLRDRMREMTAGDPIADAVRRALAVEQRSVPA